MSSVLAPIFGAGWQAFNNQGAVLAGGKLYTYAAGTTTLSTSWADPGQLTPNANPIIMDSAGRSPNEIWLQQGIAYKFVLQDSTGSPIGYAWDNIVGNYASSGSIPAANVGYSPAGTGAVATNVQTKLRESVSVLDFGADPTGAADSAAAFQAAINSLTAGTVVLPAGSFLSSALTLKTGVSLVGQGPMSKLVVKTGTADFITGTSLANVHLRDFYIDCSNQTAGGGSGMNINGFSDSSMRGVEIYNAGSFGLLMFNAIRSQYIGNTIDTTRRWDGMTISTGSSDCVISGNIVRNSYDSGIGLTNTIGISVTGNVVDRIKVAGNWFAPGIDAAGAVNAVISGNYVKGNEFGISLLLHPNTGQWPKRVTVTGNTVADGKYGIMLGYSTPSIGPFGSLQEIVVSGNNIFNQDVQGIHIDTATDAVLVSGNTVTYGSGDGIYFTASNGITLSGNQVMYNTGNGINCAAGNAKLSMIGNISQNNTASDYAGILPTSTALSANKNTAGFIHSYAYSTYGLGGELINSYGYHGGVSVTVAALATNYNIPNSGIFCGMMTVRDMTVGGSDIWLIDTNGGATKIAGNIAVTLTFNWLSVWRVNQSAGATGHSFAFGFYCNQ